MRLDKWFISNLDDSQRNIIIQDINSNVIVRGSAGSGKTNLAIHRARLAKDKGTYAILILTIALKRMVAYGMKALGLDHERIAYDWAWNNRGFDLSGDVYCDVIRRDNEGKIISVNRDVLYLVNDTTVRKFKRYTTGDSENNGTLYGIDFADWVPYVFYSAYGRRTSWFYEVTLNVDFDITNTSKYALISSGTMYKPAEDTIDYIIVDEAQDFNVQKYKDALVSRVGKSLSLFGDSAQKMNPNGSSMEDITTALGYKSFTLDYNYRLPKSIAKVAQKIAGRNIDLISNNRKDAGNSDYPHYPKPILTKHLSEEKELEDIVNRIKLEDLDDVAILVPDEADVIRVNEFLNNSGIQTQVHYRTGKTVPFHTINTLDFSNNDLPCILTYYAAKGSEFDNVFVPFVNQAKVSHRSDFYVACTRSSRNLYISYSGKITPFLSDVNNKDLVLRDLTSNICDEPF